MIPLIMKLLVVALQIRSLRLKLNLIGNFRSALENIIFSRKTQLILRKMTSNSQNLVSAKKWSHFLITQMWSIFAKKYLT